MKRAILGRFRNNTKYILFISESDQFPVEIRNRANFFRTFRYLEKRRRNNLGTRNVESLDIFYYINYFKTISSVRNCVKKGFPLFFFQRRLATEKKVYKSFFILSTSGFSRVKIRKILEDIFYSTILGIFFSPEKFLHTPRTDYIGNVSFSEIRLAQSFAERQLFAVSVARN